MIFYLGHKLDNHVDEDVRKMRNKSRQWEYGYNEQIDTVIISRDGTLGEIYNVCGLNIGLPAKPEHKDIINWDKTSSNQKWKRESLPAGINEDNWETRQYEPYVKRQMEQRRNGCWIYLNGNPVYLTGTYWFFLQWVRIEEDYPNLRVIQNELMIFWEACKADDRCYGMQYVKNRRIGASSMAVAEILSSGIRFKDKQIGLISKTGEDASDIFGRIVTAFKRLPVFFIPKTDGTNTPKKVLSFQEQTKKRAKGESISEDNGLNTNITWYTTAKNSMDGKRIFRSLIDEAGKFPKDVPFDKYWNVVKTSHQKGRVIFGKAMVVSTVNAMDEGGREYKRVWDNSDLSKRNANGRTISGLYRIFIPAKYCLEGYFDQYGFSIVEDPKVKVLADDGNYVNIGAETDLKNTLAALKNQPDDYNEQLRQFPNSERDAFRESSDECAFKLPYILEQLEHNEFELEDTEWGNNEVEIGDLYWRDGHQDTEVIWRPNPESGSFWITKLYHPPAEYRNKKERKFSVITNQNSWSPMNGHIGCLGVDPYNRDKTVDKRGSSGSIHLVTKFNTGPFPNNACILEYIHRPDKVEFFFEDVIKAAVYFGVPILPEMSNDRFSQYLVDRGYRNFVLNNPFKLWHELSDSEKKWGGINAQDKKLGDAQFYAVEAYVNDYIGISRDDSIRPLGTMGYFPFSRTLRQLKDVDVNNRTKYDAYISFSLALLGNQRREKAAPPEKKPISIPYKRYDNSGNISRAI